ncbi:unnamed protein product [Clonostachys rhizophaga]|uniref:Xylanolytic transcriptional activator regulatory domain-containing protein n=1 Tax=Clonostachys rhizophaga TaxID=160324 RepID=A0A9N9YN63_9HYPO|nr:unnamed protein product [Clonostachys rhizophaga]
MPLSRAFYPAADRCPPISSGEDNNEVEQQEAALLTENSTLRERVAYLQAIIQGRGGTRPGSSRSQSSLSAAEQGDFETFSTILEQWNLGGPEQDASQKAPLLSETSEDFSPILSLIPRGEDCRILVRFSLETLGWIHCALDASAFSIEAEAFVASLEQGQCEGLRNHAWLAIFLGVLAVGLIFMEGTDLVAQLSDSFTRRHDLAMLPRLWYTAVLRQLEFCDFIGRPGIHTVQAIAVLNLCSRHLGERQREITLTGIAISTARSLKMHLLGNELSCPERVRQMPEWQSKADRELGRRLWWSLVICDWLGAATHPPSIRADQFDCEISEGEYDAAQLLGPTAIDQHLKSASPVFHHMAMAKLASVLRSHFEEVDKSLDTLFETLMRLDELESQVPFVIDDSADQPIWAIGQRCHFYFTLNHLRLKLCRVLFRPDVKSFDRYDNIRKCALSAAIAISDMTDFPYVYKKTWYEPASRHCSQIPLLANQCNLRIFPSATIAAGVFLALDLLKFRPEATVEHQKQRILSCMSTIAPYVEKTTICRGGSRILQQLLELIRQCENGMQQVDVMQFIIGMDSRGVMAVENPSIQQQNAWQHLSLDNIDDDSSALFGGHEFFENWNLFDDWNLLGSDFKF